MREEEGVSPVAGQVVAPGAEHELHGGFKASLREASELRMQPDCEEIAATVKPWAVIQVRMAGSDPSR